MGYYSVVAQKGSRSIKFSPELENELLALQGTFIGSNKSEIITFILKDWLKTNRDFVTAEIAKKVKS